MWKNGRSGYRLYYTHQCKCLGSTYKLTIDVFLAFEVRYAPGDLARRAHEQRHVDRAFTNFIDLFYYLIPYEHKAYSSEAECEAAFEEVTTYVRSREVEFREKGTAGNRLVHLLLCVPLTAAGQWDAALVGWSSPWP